MGRLTNGALDSTGQAWMWGSNASGQCGCPDVNQNSPIVIYGNHSFTKVAVYSQSAFGLKADGTVWSWGANSSGQLGDNTIVAKSSPVSVVGAHSFIDIVTTNQGSVFGLKADGTVWGWGLNTTGQLGDNTILSKSSPVSVVGAHSFILIYPTRTVGAVSSLFALKANGECWSWGNNVGGLLGDGTATNRSSPVSVVGGHLFTKLFMSDQCNNMAVWGLKADNTMWAWGDNTSGALGDLTATTRSSPVSVVGNHSFTLIVHTGSPTAAGLKADGTVWTWGAGSGGVLGDQTTTAKSSPVSVVGAHSFISIKAIGNNNAMTALKADGSVWTWGQGSSGVLGDNTTTNKSSPVIVVGAHSFTAVSTGDTQCHGIKADGSIWSWGINTVGTLGDGTFTTRSSPVSVVGMTIAQAFTGEYSNFCTFKDNTGLTWGMGANGLGAATNASKSSPISVRGAHSFIMLVYGGQTVFGLKADGTVWSWGSNASGIMGDNTITGKSSPVSVVGAHSFTSIGITNASGTTVQTGYGIKADGSLWSWGSNVNGNIGDNSVTGRSSPVSVVGNHSFTTVIIDDFTMMGIKADGSIWTWGQTSAGSLGDGANSTRSSPVSVIGGMNFSILLNSMYAGSVIPSTKRKPNIIIIG